MIGHFKSQTPQFHNRYKVKYRKYNNNVAKVPTARQDTRRRHRNQHIGNILEKQLQPARSPS